MSDEDFNSYDSYYSDTSATTPPGSDWTFSSTDGSVDMYVASSGDGLDNGLTTDEGSSSDKAIIMNDNVNNTTALNYSFGTTDGSNFQLDSFQLANVEAASGATNLEVAIYSDGALVGSATIDLTTSSSSGGITYTYDGDYAGDPNLPYGTFTFSSAYGNVDEIRLSYDDEGGTRAGAVAIDNINVSDVVTVVEGTVQCGTWHDDTLTGNAGDDILYGKWGDDVLVGNAGADLILGGWGDDTLTGDSGDDTLWGGVGDDALSGGSGDDLMFAGFGNDTLNGGDGDDTVVGSLGCDTFVFDAASGNDIVVAFSTRHDDLDLTAYGITDTASLTAASSQTTVEGTMGLMVDLGGGNSVFLVGLDAGDIGRVDLVA
ncbi:calcium-binding protein [Kordiimonas sp.]|uniref:calcium-binding protein n=1 Tax=Kordiimonas sp. TaxID=1970157 RepID=UPI003A91F808